MLRRGWCDRQGADHRRDELGQCVAGKLRTGCISYTNTPAYAPGSPSMISRV
jgi:hypothetical protein